MAADPLFQRAFINTLLILVVVGVTIFVLAFSMSLVLRNMWGKGIVRAVIFFPIWSMLLVFGALAGFVFNPHGLVNAMLRPLGVDEPPSWLAQDNIFVLIMITLVVTHTGYFTTILMAGVDRIPPDYFEVASLAGCNAWQRLKYVIIPLTWEVFATCAVLWTISSVKIFELHLGVRRLERRGDPAHLQLDRRCVHLCHGVLRAVDPRLRGSHRLRDHLAGHGLDPGPAHAAGHAARRHPVLN